MRACSKASPTSTVRSFASTGRSASSARAGGPCYRCLYPEPPPRGSRPDLRGGRRARRARRHRRRVAGERSAQAACSASASRSSAGCCLSIALSARVREVRFERDPHCALCGDRPIDSDVAAIDGDARCDDERRRDRCRPRSTRRSRDAMLLDVREPHEAVLGSSTARCAFPRRSSRRVCTNSTARARYIVACRVGAKSLWAVRRLRDAGFTRLRASARRPARVRRATRGVRILLRMRRQRVRPDRDRAAGRSGRARGTCPKRGARAKEAQRAIRRGIELGMTHLDTAEMYGVGARRGACSATRSRDCRASALRREQSVCRATRRYRRNARALPNAASRGCGCEYLDLYMLHWPGDASAATRRCARLETLVDAGQDALRRREQLRRSTRCCEARVVSARRPARVQSSALPSARTRHRTRA